MNRIKFKRRIGQVRCAAKYYIVYMKNIQRRAEILRSIGFDA